MGGQASDSGRSGIIQEATASSLIWHCWCAVQACGGHDAGGDLKRPWGWRCPATHHSTACQSRSCSQRGCSNGGSATFFGWFLLSQVECAGNVAHLLAPLHLFPCNQQSSVRVPVKHQKSKSTRLETQCLLFHWNWGIGVPGLLLLLLIICAGRLAQQTGLSCPTVLDSCIAGIWTTDRVLAGGQVLQLNGSTHSLAACLLDQPGPLLSAGVAPPPTCFRVTRRRTQKGDCCWVGHPRRQASASPK